MAPRMVFDTDVLVAGFSSATGAFRRLLVAVLDAEITMLLSTPLLVEYEAVLARPAMFAMAGVTGEQVAAVLDQLAGLCLPVAFDYRWRPQTRDPDDDFVLETAVNGAAEVLVSFNVRDMQAGAQRFGIAVERPNVARRRLGQ